MKNLRFIAAALLPVLLASIALLPRGAEAMDRLENVESRCAEDELLAASGSSCAAEPVEQQEPRPIQLNRLHARQAGVPAALLLVGMALLSAATGVALGRACGSRPPTAGHRPPTADR